MFKNTLLTVFVLFPSLASASLERGKQLFDKASCIDCHNVQKFKPREEKINNFTKLLGIVDACAHNAETGWFDEEVMDVSRYLNHHYYKFKIKQ